MKDTHLIERLLPVWHDKMPLSIRLSCRQCNDEANQLFYETAALVNELQPRFLASPCLPFIHPTLSPRKSRTETADSDKIKSTIYTDAAPSLTIRNILPTCHACCPTTRQLSASFLLHVTLVYQRLRKIFYALARGPLFQSRFNMQVVCVLLWPWSHSDGYFLVG